jgi:hypothetical protein
LYAPCSPRAGVKIAWVQLGDVQSALCANGLVWDLHSRDAAEAAEVQGAACVLRFARRVRLVQGEGRGVSD